MKDLVILITGGSGGIGAATAIRLATPSPPFKVKAIAIHYNSNKKLVEGVLVKVQKANPDVRVKIFQADMANSEQIQRLHDDVVKEFGSINVLFANAGTTNGKVGPTGDLENVTLADFEVTWRVNTLAPFQLTQLVVPSMVEKGFGRVIYCSSVAALTGGVVGPHYASSKSALHGMIHFLAMKYAKDGVTFNGVAPALIEDTTMLPQGSDELRARVPVGRLGKPEEVASVVQLMVENGYISNKVWAVDGGWHPS